MPASFVRSSARTLLVRTALAALAIGCGALARPADARAQRDTVPLAASDTVLEIRLADGSVIYGRIVSSEGGRIVIQTAARARIEVERAQVRSARAVGGETRDGEVWFRDPHRDRLFLGPTGRSLAAGEGFFGVYQVFVPVVSYGLTDWFSITGGIPVVPGAFGEVAYVEPKLRLPLPAGSQADVSVGASVLFGTGGEGAAGLLYAAGTIGGEDHAVHVTAGYPFISGDGDDEIIDQPVVMLGGETRVSRRIKLLTENYFLPGEEGVFVIGGVRIFGERLSADAGLGAFLGDGCDLSACILPVVNFAYTFGRK